MKRVMTILLVLTLLLSSVVYATADNGSVIYDGIAGRFIFQPGSEHSLTDLFPNFKGVMPGDSLRQLITVKNDTDNRVKVEIYIRSLGAQEGSEEFLSQLQLRVEKSENNEMGYMFDAYANETAQLTDWVCLGMLYSGGEVNLNVILDVPLEMGNEFQDQIGYLDWEFKVIEYPIDPDDPTPPTGDDIEIWLMMLPLCGGAMLLLILLHKKREEQGGAANV